MLLWYLNTNWVNVGNPQHENTVSGLVLCRHNRGMLAKSADVWLSGRHVANMSATFPAKQMAMLSTNQCTNVPTRTRNTIGGTPNNYPCRTNPIYSAPPLHHYPPQYPPQYQQPFQQQFVQQGGGRGGGSRGRRARRGRGAGGGRGPPMPMPYIKGNQMIPYIPAGMQNAQPANARLSNITKSFANQNVCFTCGFDVKDWHMSAICLRKKQGHQDGFTR
jgi:hypothetical protein